MWYARPVFFVADVNRAARFYLDVLGFERDWQSDEGAGPVCQVNRSGCEIILCEAASRHDKARLFVELNVLELARLQEEITARAIPVEATWWGYDSIQVHDPDGNELIFPIEGNSPADPSS